MTSLKRKIVYGITGAVTSAALAAGIYLHFIKEEIPHIPRALVLEESITPCNSLEESEVKTKYLERIVGTDEYVVRGDTDKNIDQVLLEKSYSKKTGRPELCYHLVLKLIESYPPLEDEQGNVITERPEFYNLEIVEKKEGKSLTMLSRLIDPGSYVGIPYLDSSWIYFEKTKFGFDRIGKLDTSQITVLNKKDEARYLQFLEGAEKKAYLERKMKKFNEIIGRDELFEGIKVIR